MTRLAAPFLRRSARFGKAEDGAAAVEFAIVAWPFFLMIFVILETALAKFSDRMLQHGTTEIARKIRTGQIRPSQFTEQLFRDELCALPTMAAFDCAKIEIDVKQITNWQPTGVPKKPDGDLDNSNFGFQPGCRSTINVVRLYYKQPVVLNYLTAETIHNGQRIMVGSEAFLTEPYSGGC